MTININYKVLDDLMTQRTVDLKRFQGQFEVLQEYLGTLNDFQAELSDLMVCFQELDADAKKALPSNVVALLEVEGFERRFARFLGDDDSLGFRHLFNKK